MLRLGIFALIFCASVLRADFVEPARGTAARKALMDALRPHVEWQLGAPVEFVIHDLRLAEGQGLPGAVAFASATVQRPGGGAIDYRQTPGYQRGYIDPDFMKSMTVQALYRKVGDTWVAVHWGIGARQSWFTIYPFCEDYFAVIPEHCAS